MPWYAWLILALALGSILGSLLLLRDTAKKLPLSEEQLKLSQERARAAGLAKAVKFELRDYREMEGQFDRIVSVGMFEHVGAVHYNRFFEQIGGLLAPNPSGRDVGLRFSNPFQDG